MTRRTSIDPSSLSALVEEAVRAERAADWITANAAYRRVFWAALDEHDLASAADALRGQSRASQQRKELEEAEEFAQLSLHVAQANRFSQPAARAFNTLAVIHFLQGDHDAASSLYLSAMEQAIDCGDDALIGWSCQNRGVIANLRGDLVEAKALYLESVASSVRSGDTTTGVTAFNNLGIISADLEEWTDSLLYFDRGLELADELGDVGVQATLLSNRAEPLIHIGEMGEAMGTLESAEELALQIGDERTLSEVHRFRGLIARLQHRSEEAEALLKRAMTIARQGGHDLEHAEAMEEIARLRWQQERFGAARITARAALEQFEDLSAGHNAGRVRRLLEDWSSTSAAEVVLPDPR